MLQVAQDLYKCNAVTSVHCYILMYSKQTGNLKQLLQEADRSIFSGNLRKLVISTERLTHQYYANTYFYQYNTYTVQDTADLIMFQIYVAHKKIIISIYKRSQII